MEDIESLALSIITQSVEDYKKAVNGLVLFWETYGKRLKSMYESKNYYTEKIANLTEMMSTWDSGSSVIFLKNEIKELEQKRDKLMNRLIRMRKDHPAAAHYASLHNEIIRFYSSDDYTIFNYDGTINIRDILERIDEETGFNKIKQKYADCITQAPFAINLNWRF